MRTGDTPVCFNSENYTEKELREQKKVFEKLLLQLKRMLDDDELSEEDIDCIQQVKDTVSSYVDMKKPASAEVYYKLAGERKNVRFCEKCGVLVREDDSFCSNCGSRIGKPELMEPELKSVMEQSAMINVMAGRICLNCGAVIGEDDLYCASCGSRVNRPMSGLMEPEMQKTVHKSIQQEKKQINDSSISKGQEIFVPSHSIPCKNIDVRCKKSVEPRSFIAKHYRAIIVAILCILLCFLAVCFIPLYIIAGILAVVLFVAMVIGLRIWREMEIKQYPENISRSDTKWMENDNKKLQDKVNDLKEKNWTQQQTIDNLQKENTSLQKKLSELPEIQSQLQILRMVIKQIGISYEEIDEILEMTKKLKKNISIPEEKLEMYVGEILQVAKDRKQSALYNIKKEHFEKKAGNLFIIMRDESQDFLITAEVLYDLMQDYGSNCDFSSICLLASKAMEIEMRIRYFDYYKSYLEKQFGSMYRKWPGTMLCCGEPAVFCSMGNIRRIAAGRNDQGEIYIRRSFLSYAKQEMFHAEILENVEQEIQFQLDCIDKVRVEYRNPAAHSNRFTSEEAKVCLCYIVEEQQVLFAMLKTYKK